VDGAALRRAGQDPDGGDPAGPGGLRGARSELRRQMRERRRLRTGILALVSLVLLGAVPLYFGIRTLARDPVFDTLDALDVPGWASTQTVDNVSGSRWCLQDCRLRERTVQSQRSSKETAQVYEQALARDGWQRWKVGRCPEQPAKGSYTCWRRDELTLDLWVRDPTCVPPPVDGEPAPSPAPAPTAGKCAGSLVSVKVRNAIDDERTGPQPSTDPSLTGEDPFPTLTDDPLREQTRSPS
jgi:integrin beta 3